MEEPGNSTQNSHNLLDKTYLASEVEAKWYSNWEEAGCFKGSTDEGKNSFCVLMPPPNVTGILHIGHTLNNLLQDILIRWARLKGKQVLWIPGTDHAGIATQTKVERALKNEGLTRQGLGREKFLQKACEWRDKHGNIIFKQLKRLGVSCTWERNVHTLDAEYTKAVITSFVELYRKGYIYRGTRLVNWCPVSLTALSDEEVIMKPVNGKLYTFLYPIVGENECLAVATTRPETIMGDVALAVNPTDTRFQKLIGKRCQAIFSPDSTLPIIADSMVDKEFGTGVVKITPAHDANDFEVGRRHGLPSINILNDDATLNENGKPFERMDRLAAREAVIEALRQKNLLVKIEEYEHTVGFSERADVPIEPRLSQQWFLRYPKVEEAKKCVENGTIKFWPKRWEKTYLHWLENIRDWCISRQLWWGHRIPVWYKKDGSGEIHVSVDGPSAPENWEQDPDVLDTWFSSWLWPFGTFGWPNKTKMEQNHFESYFPTNVLVTGPDILFFWVARMIMASLELLEDRPIESRIPFRHVYLTGIIRDAKGRKMSKSLGNSPDPLDLIERYGADGVRIGLLSIAPQGQDICFDEKYLEQGRNFCTKLWNACRFRQMQEVTPKPLNETLQKLELARLTSFDIHILYALNRVIESFNLALETFEFNSAIKLLIQFFRNDFCDGYLEFIKYVKSESTFEVQDICLRYILKMLHPIAPFITEELWYRMGYGSTLIAQSTLETDTFAQWLKRQNLEKMGTAWLGVEALKTIISDLRALKAEWGLASNKSVCMQVHPRPDKVEFLTQNRLILCNQVGLQSLDMVERSPDRAMSQHPAKLTDIGTFYLLIEKSIDINKETARLEKEKQTIEGHITSAKAKLLNKKFTCQAPTTIVEATQKLHDENQKKLIETEKLLAQIKRMQK